jgi:protein-disulfide isomerase
MSTRVERKVAAREARLAHEAHIRAAAAAARRRTRTLLGVLAAAAAVVIAAIAISSGNGGRANAASGGKLNGASFSAKLFTGIPQHGNVLGSSSAPVRMVEFADLQCPYCDAYTVSALPTLVQNYVRTGKVSMQFENLSFIGPDSVTAGRTAAATAQQNKLWNFVDLLYLNQGQENTGYVTPSYLNRLLGAVPGLNVAAALTASQAPPADSALAQANAYASQAGVSSTPTFLIGRASGPLRQFQPQTLSPAPFEAALNSALRGTSR